MPGVVLTTPRLVLRPFTDVDLDPFYELNAHPRVVELLGSAPSRADCEAEVARANVELEREGWGAWAVEERDGAPFVGLVGLHRVGDSLPCAPAVEVAWRLHPDYWGHGYATEAAWAALRHGFDAGGLDEIIAFTTTRNVRSQAVMVRLGMVHHADGDFDHPRLPADSPLRRHVLYRVTASQLVPTLAS
jgi:RimJ/RimL family protein N-acetyltransferase